MISPDRRSIESISVIGLGKLGLCTAVCIAHAGIKVVGVDVDEATVDAVNRGHSPFEEPGLQQLLSQSSGQLSATSDYATAVKDTQITLIVVPTPSQSSGAFSAAYAVSAGHEIGKTLAEKSTYHVVSLVSTVLPGTTVSELIPAIESSSGKKHGVDFGICYSPEFVALGSVVRDFLNPDFVLIGEGDSRAGDMLECMYRKVCSNDPPVRRMNIVSAELAKIAVNTFVTTKITFANMLGQICDGLEGADVDAVTETLGMDSRIGPKYLKAGTGYGGPCFPRDNRALEFLAESVGASSHLPRATDTANREMTGRFADRIEQMCPPGGTVAVLGLSYKPGTWVVEESQPVQIAAELARRGFEVRVYDPLALETARVELGEAVTYSTDMKRCIKGADAVLIATPDPMFGTLSRDDFGHDKRVAIYDAWRILDSTVKCSGIIGYSGFGQNELGLADANSLVTRE